MARIHVDFSVFSAYAAQGIVCGFVEVAEVPLVGSVVLFTNPKRAVPFPEVPGFSPQIRVEHSVFPDHGMAADAVLSLADVNVVTSAEAQRVFEFFERGFDLFVDRFYDAHYE